MYTREPWSEYSHHVQHADFHHSQVRNFDQPRHNPSHDVEDDEMPFLEYIMSMKLSRGFKPPTDMEPYDGSFDPQEHMDTFKSKMALAGASDPVRCRAFPITLKKAALKWYNSLPSRSICKFSDL